MLDFLVHFSIWILFLIICSELIEEIVAQLKTTLRLIKELKGNTP